MAEIISAEPRKNGHPCAADSKNRAMTTEFHFKHLDFLLRIMEMRKVKTGSTIFTLPDTVFATIVQKFNNLDDIINFELSHPTIAETLDRCFWGTLRAIYVGFPIHKSQAQYSMDPSQVIESRMVTTTGHSIALPSTSKAMSSDKCGLNNECDVLGWARNMKELHIGPWIEGEKKSSSIQKLISSAIHSNLVLNKLSMVYVNADAMLDPFVTSPVEPFPSRNAHNKITRLIRQQSESLNEIRVQFGTDQIVTLQRWPNRRELRIEYSGNCSANLRQVLYPILSGFTYASRQPPKTIRLKLNVQRDTIPSVIDFCLSTALSPANRASVTAVRVHLPQMDKVVTSAATNANSELFPLIGMTRLQTVHWHFEDSMMDHDQFRSVCAQFKPLKSAALVISTRAFRQMIAAPNWGVVPTALKLEPIKECD
ncbi:hypothetical protein DdX_04435 [Ditylenchus destructor]|uniref:Uncharacterized protein n=1 Tax=Ditylenchus destructor TaxID=166010 RepID=A0AAD4ND22_9BILA|nr:hypothetical protein DdX_04435 [Ditylenchus destructor]